MGKLRCRDCPYYKEYVPGVGFCNKDAQFVEAIQEKCGEEEVDIGEYNSNADRG
jgi:hypothetical protein